MSFGGRAGGSGSGYQVVSGGLGLCTAAQSELPPPPPVSHVLRNYCLPGFYQDNIECPYFTSETISSGIQLGRGNPNPQAEGVSKARRHLPEPWPSWPSWTRLQPQHQLLTSRPRSGAGLQLSLSGWGVLTQCCPEQTRPRGTVVVVVVVVVSLLCFVLGF